MNKTEIRDILNAHKEHFRVLPTNAMLDLQGIIQSIDADNERDQTGPYTLGKMKEKLGDLGNRVSKAKAKPKRPKR